MSIPTRGLGTGLIVSRGLGSPGRVYPEQFLCLELTGPELEKALAVCATDMRAATLTAEQLAIQMRDFDAANRINFYRRNPTTGVWTYALAGPGNWPSAQPVCMEAFEDGSLIAGIPTYGSFVYNPAGPSWSGPAGIRARDLWAPDKSSAQSGNVVWAVDYGFYAKYTGSWATGPISGASGVERCWGYDDNECWVTPAVFTSVQQLYRTQNGGTSWTDLHPQLLSDTGLTIQRAVGVWGVSPSEVYIATNYGHLILYNGSTFSILGQSAANYDGQAVWGYVDESGQAIVFLATNWFATPTLRTYRWNGSTLSLVDDDPTWNPNAGAWRITGTRDGRLVQVIGNEVGSYPPLRESTDGGLTWADSDASYNTIVHVAANFWKCWDIRPGGLVLASPSQQERAITAPAPALAASLAVCPGDQSVSLEVGIQLDKPLCVALPDMASVTPESRLYVASVLTPRQIEEFDSTIPGWSLLPVQPPQPQPDFVSGISAASPTDIWISTTNWTLVDTCWFHHFNGTIYDVSFGQSPVSINAKVSHAAGTSVFFTGNKNWAGVSRGVWGMYVGNPTLTFLSWGPQWPARSASNCITKCVSDTLAYAIFQYPGNAANQNADLQRWTPGGGVQSASGTGITGGGHAVGMDVLGNEIFVLLNNGEVWRGQWGSPFVLDNATDGPFATPFPASSSMFNTLLTATADGDTVVAVTPTSNQCWVRNGPDNWTNVGPAVGPTFPPAGIILGVNAATRNIINVSWTSYSTYTTDGGSSWLLGEPTPGGDQTWGGLGAYSREGASRREVSVSMEIETAVSASVCPLDTSDEETSLTVEGPQLSQALAVCAALAVTEETSLTFPPVKSPFPPFEEDSAVVEQIGEGPTTVQHLLIGAQDPPKLWLWNPTLGDIEEFSPQLPVTLTGSGPIRFYCAPTGEIVCSAARPSDDHFEFYHYVSGAWVDVASCPGPGDGVRIFGIDGSSYDNVWAVFGDTKVVWCWDGNTWQEDAALSGAGRLEDIFVVDENHIFVASDDGFWFRTGGAKGSGVWVNKWTDAMTALGITPTSPTDCFAVWAADADTVFWSLRRSTTTGWIVRSDGDGGSWWKTDPGSKYSSFGGMFGLSASAIWYYGVEGGATPRVKKFDGSVTLINQTSLSGIAGTNGDLVMENATHGFAAGEDPTNQLSLWETTDGSTWSRILLKGIGGFDGPVGLALWPEVIPPSPAPGEGNGIVLEIPDLFCE